MLTKSRQTGMFCFFTAIALIATGYGIWKKEKTDWIPGYRHKPGENTSAYCMLTGKGVMLAGTGLFVLSIPLSLERPDKIFALCCLISCLVFTGMGIGCYIRAEKRYRS